ncbi:X-linked interleukin-1 receptor accessory protein-like 2 isoform X2 [Macrobrachium nipponense]|uniref:X-linked interleukin-1 receptor accessory protein-like 2 isoform X2 n=1 Tax=Macrobrachium nipponense TaxID=159736 RepID=UPI0030C7FF47
MGQCDPLLPSWKSMLPDDVQGSSFISPTASNGFQEGPKDVKARSEVCSWKGGSVNLTCEGMVGKPEGDSDSEASIEWFKLVDGELDYLPDAVNPTAPTVASDGTIKSTIVFNSVESDNFGIYVCNVKNMYSAIVRNISFIEGDPQYCGTVNASKMSVLVLAPIAFIILAIPYLGWRFRTTVKLMYKERRHKKYTRDGFLRDVFIVHGNKASSWVFSELVHTLEEKYGYSCYVPVRDMLGGDQYAEAISKEMRKCRRVLVVVTPCLLQSQWASWSATHGIGTCFKSSSILRLVLQDFGNDALSSETAVFLKTLKPIAMLKVPKACRLQEKDIPAMDEDEEPRKNLGNGFFGDHLGENTSVLMTESSLSPSPKHQRLSNMITGSNNTSRETLNEGHDCRKEEQKKVVVPPVIYLEDIDCAKEPGSPCSVTPFILPTCKNREQDSPPCFPFLNCMRAVFIGDPETVFWQKVRLFLDPPTVRRKITLESMA